MKNLITTTALALALTAAPAFADTPLIAPGATALSLSAEGETTATPDMATISFGVQTQAKTAADALKANNARMTAVLAALKASGIAARDIQTSNLNLNPQYTYGSNQPPVLNGYQASDQISVKIEDLAQTGPTIDAVVKAGINQIDSINFGLKDESAALDTARKNAVATLSQRAQLYTAATGMHLSRLVAIEEGAPQSIGPRPVYAMARMAVPSAAPTPVESGELKLSVTVSATYELTK